ncbi:MAG TPA: chemotaxis-specific protein-glutamate methyltransferase CheB [Rhodocyclaceae bacterium]|nr:chemotaxis-specific protein-glutamate methyltransferase CheB [Rhodocyclaceae bacterium]
MPTGTIRVLIADDSALARGLLRAFLESEDGIEVIGEAVNGREAVALVRELKPDLVTMDLEMPVMGGLEAIGEIMHSKAVPILVVSSVADAHNALEAVAQGALEVVAKPDYSPAAAAEFVAKVRMLAGVSVITRLRPKSASPAAVPVAAASPAPVTKSAPATAGQPVFAIACSTGGPQALAQILPALPADFPAPILVAQHISDGFAGGMVDWLNSLSPLPVKLGAEGDAILPGIIYVSPSERHLAVTPNHRLTLVERGPDDIYRPSCDVLLKSVARVFASRAVGIILTGMGSDGVAGLAAIREAGGQTYGQDEASSVIYGMNRVAVERGATQRTLPLGDIAGAMAAAARGFGGGAA